MYSTPVKYYQGEKFKNLSKQRFLYKLLSASLQAIFHISFQTISSWKPDTNDTNMMFSLIFVTASFTKSATGIASGYQVTTILSKVFNDAEFTSP